MTQVPAGWKIEYFPPTNVGRSTITVDSIDDVTDWVSTMIPNASVGFRPDNAYEFIDHTSSAVALVSLIG